MKALALPVLSFSYARMYGKAEKHLISSHPRLLKKDCYLCQDSNPFLAGAQGLEP